MEPEGREKRTAILILTFYECRPEKDVHSVVVFIGEGGRGEGVALKISPSEPTLVLLRRRGHATSITIEISSVTIFRTRSIGSIGMRACELGLCCYF